MRLYLSLPALAGVALLGLSAGGAWAGRFFGPVSSGADSRYPYPNPAYNSFDYSPRSPYQAQHSLFRRLGKHP
jgi:hypothetical protein